MFYQITWSEWRITWSLRHLRRQCLALLSHLAFLLQFVPQCEEGELKYFTVAKGFGPERHVSSSSRVANDLAYP